MRWLRACCWGLRRRRQHGGGVEGVQELGDLPLSRLQLRIHRGRRAGEHGGRDMRLGTSVTLHGGLGPRELEAGGDRCGGGGGLPPRFHVVAFHRGDGRLLVVVGRRGGGQVLR